MTFRLRKQVIRHETLYLNVSVMNDALEEEV